MKSTRNYEILIQNPETGENEIEILTIENSGNWKEDFEKATEIASRNRNFVDLIEI